MDSMTREGLSKALSKTSMSGQLRAEPQIATEKP